MTLTLDRRVFSLFGDLLEYPGAGLAGSVEACEALVAAAHPEAAARLAEFRAFLAGAPRGRVEEAYTATFDLGAAIHPYVGYHLFGESYKRSLFLLGLKERFRASGFTQSGNELPDHVVVLLRFLACADPAPALELIGEAMLPALDRMLGGGEEAPREVREGAGLTGAAVGPPRRPYRAVLEALRLVLRGQGALAPGCRGPGGEEEGDHD